MDDDRDESRARRGPGAEEASSEDAVLPPKAPWHFKLLAVGTVGYLGYRLYQGIGWLVHHA